MYADDLTIFVRDVDSINILQSIFEKFRIISGLKVIKDKTNILFWAKDRSENSTFCFGKVVNVIKIVGIYFSADSKIKEEMNYKEILSKIKRLLGWWKQLDLTLMGKIQLMKVYAISKFFRWKKFALNFFRQVRIR